jgi:hypothetical protein
MAEKSIPDTPPIYIVSGGAGALGQHRRWRQRSMAGTAGRGYTDPSGLYEELDMARQVFRKGGFAVVDVTGKPVEESADEIIARITRWFERKVSVPILVKRR